MPTLPLGRVQFADSCQSCLHLGIAKCQERSPKDLLSLHITFPLLLMQS